MLGESPAPRGVYEPAQATKSSLQGATAGFVRKFFGIPVTNFISAMDAIAPNSDPKGLYWTTSPTVRGGLCQNENCAECQFLASLYVIMQRDPTYY